jgi:hypothetical protein
MVVLVGVRVLGASHGGTRGVFARPLVRAGQRRQYSPTWPTAHRPQPRMTFATARQRRQVDRHQVDRVWVEFDSAAGPMPGVCAR